MKSVTWRGVYLVSIATIALISMWASYYAVAQDVLLGKGVWQYLVGVLVPFGIACWVYCFTIAFLGVCYLISVAAFFTKEN